MQLAGVIVGAAMLAGNATPPPRGVEGVWRNTRNTVHLRVAKCGPALCGTVIWANAAARADAIKGSGQNLIGSRLLSDLRRKPDGSWQGQVYVPDIDKRGSAKVIQLGPNKLRVSGCMVAGLVCQTRHWDRIR
jgi:uncharacterized protein (DUF2147 family)